MSNNYVMNIAIVGATGSVGKWITRSLLEGGKHNVTAITRPDSKSAIPEGVKIVKVGYDDKAGLVDALKGQQALIISLSISAAEGTQNKLIEAAAESGVEYIMPNEYSPEFV